MSIDFKKAHVELGFTSKDNLIAAVSSIPFGNKIGAPLRFEEVSNDLVSTSWNRIPGLMRIALGQTIGYENEGLNSVAGKLYADLIKRISGAKTIEKSDYMMYLIGGKTIIDTFRILKTVYQLVFEYKQYNLYYGSMIIKALGYDPDDLAANIEDFRGYLNRCIRRFSSLNYPNIPYLKSGWDYGRTILVDNPDLEHAQAYIFDLPCTAEWDPTSDPNGTKLIFHHRNLDTDLRTFATIRIVMDQVLDSYLFDDDVIDISAWIDNIYGDKLLTLTDCNPDINDVQIIFDPEALAIVENLEILPCTGGNSTHDVVNLDVTQLNNFVSQQGLRKTGIIPSYQESRNMGSIFMPHVYNFHKAKPSYDAIARATSLKLSKRPILSHMPASFGYSIDITADYGVMNITVFANPNDFTDQFSPYCHSIYSMIDIVTVDMTAIHRTTLLETFAYHPLYFVDNRNTNAGAYDKQYNCWDHLFPFYDFDNYTVLANTVVDNILNAMWYIIFGLEAK